MITDELDLVNHKSGNHYEPPVSNLIPPEKPKVIVSYKDAVASSVPKDVYFEEPTEKGLEEEEEEEIDESMENSQFDLNEDLVEEDPMKPSIQLPPSLLNSCISSGVEELSYCEIDG